MDQKTTCVSLPMGHRPSLDAPSLDAPSLDGPMILEVVPMDPMAPMDLVVVVPKDPDLGL